MPRHFERERRRRSRERREQYEFSASTKSAVYARAGGYCEHCTIRAGEEYHHVISIDQAIAFNYAPQHISSAVNCLLTCRSCHIELDGEIAVSKPYEV